jgi:hypothetical protein
MTPPIKGHAQNTPTTEFEIGTSCMRIRAGKLLSITLICVVLCACTSVLIGNKAQSMVTKALFKSLMGVDISEVKILENPLIKSRMQALLGDKYEPAMKLLNTAQEIQQEGALFYIASRYAPPKFQEITDKAGMVWNSDTNQMAVMLIKDGKAEILSEQVVGAKKLIEPVLPKELQTAYNKAKAAQKAIEDKQKALENTLENATNTAIEKSTQAVGSQLGVSEETQTMMTNVAKGDSAEKIVTEKFQEKKNAIVDEKTNDAKEALETQGIDKELQDAVLKETTNE